MLFLPTNDSFEVLNVDTREKVEHFDVVASDESLPQLDEVHADSKSECEMSYPFFST